MQDDSTRVILLDCCPLDRENRLNQPNKESEFLMMKNVFSSCL